MTDKSVNQKNIAKNYLKLGKFNLAKKALLASIQHYQNDADVYNLLGIVNAKLQKEKDAILNFKEAIKLNNELEPPFYNLMEIYEKSNQHQNLEDTISSFLLKFNSNEYVLFYYSIILENKNEIKEAKKLLESLLFTKNIEWQIKKNYRLANLNHKIRNFNEAFVNYENANRMRLTSINNDLFKKNKFIDELESLINITTKNEFFKKTKNNKIKLAFIVGFPRSGTTLLDTILRSNSKTFLLEEKPLIFQTIKILRENNIDFNSDKISIYANEVYTELLKRHIDIKEIENKILIDRNPLNIARITLINKFFPEAKIVVCVRHPLDCVFSCFSQDFAINNAMVNFLDLNRSAEIYNKVMTIYKNYKTKHMNNIIYEIKYEELISNYKEQVLNLINFLNIKWEESMENFTQAAKKRERIRTASYNQVNKELYNNSVYKWRNYEHELKNIKLSLSKWESYFKYTN